MSEPYLYIKCKFKQGTHCTKIGARCIEERWFNDGVCLIAERIKYRKWYYTENVEPRSAPPKKP